MPRSSQTKASIGPGCGAPVAPRSERSKEAASRSSATTRSARLPGSSDPIRQETVAARGQDVIVEPRKQWASGLPDRKGLVRFITLEETVSLFIDNDLESGDWAAELKPKRVELYTEPFARAFERVPREELYQTVLDAAGGPLPYYE